MRGAVLRRTSEERSTPELDAWLTPTIFDV